MGLKEKFGKRFIVTCELGGTEGTDVEKSILDAEKLKGADAINIIDCAMAKLRINTFALAHILQNELEVCCVPHLTRRDRSILALQSDLLGAHALGIRYTLATTGDPPKHGPYKDSSSVYNVNTVGLIQLIDNLNKGLDYNGDEIKGSTDFMVSATATPAAKNLIKEVERVQKKVDAGAGFLQTQPVYDVDQVKRFLEKVEPLGIHTLIGVMPLKSAKMAKYMNDKVPGIEVPDHVIEQFENYGSGIPIAKEFINQIYELASGVHLLAIGHVGNMSQLIEHVQGLNKGS